MSDIASAIVSTLREPVLILDEDLSVRLANRAFFEQFGTDAGETLGRPVYELGEGQWDIPELRRALAEVLGARGTVLDYRLEHDFRTLGRRIMMLNARRLEDEPGGERILLAIYDITESERLRNEVVARAEFGDKVIDSVRESLLVLDPSLRVQNANEPFLSTFRVAREEIQGRLIYELGNGQWDIPELRRALEEILPSNDAFDDFEVTHEFPAIGQRTMLLNGRRLDHMPQILLAIWDVTEQRRHQADQRVLMGELQHRVKNILANVQATATATLRRSRSLEEFEEAFLQRLASMARTQDVLMRVASGRADVGELVRMEVQAHGWEEDGRITIEGPPVALLPREAQVLAMLLHELITNAHKYGAFAHPDGRVAIRWRTDWRGAQAYFEFEWRESGVPVAGPPERKGFGSRLIEHSVRYTLGGTSSLDFTPTGVVWSASFPLGDGGPRESSW